MNLARLYNTILNKLEPVYAQLGQAAVYKHYTDTVDGEDVYTEFSVTVLGGKPGKWSTVAGDVQFQEGKQIFHFREQDLPEGLDPKDLGKNDRVIINSQTLDIASARHIPGLVVKLEVEGG